MPINYAFSLKNNERKTLEQQFKYLKKRRYTCNGQIIL